MEMVGAECEAREDLLQIEWAMKFCAKKQRQSVELVKSSVEWLQQNMRQPQQFTESFEEEKKDKEAVVWKFRTTADIGC